MLRPREHDVVIALVADWSWFRQHLADLLRLQFT